MQEGKHLDPSTVPGLVEVMKNFYEVKSDVPGVLQRFFLTDGEAVDVGRAIAEVLGDAEGEPRQRKDRGKTEERQGW